MNNFDKEYNSIYTNICESTCKNYQVDSTILESLRNISPASWMDVDWVIHNSSYMSGAGFGGKRYFKGPMGGWYRIGHFNDGDIDTVKSSTVRVEDPDLLQKLEDRGPSGKHPVTSTFGLGKARRSAGEMARRAKTGLKTAYDSDAAVKARVAAAEAGRAGAAGLRAGAKHVATSRSPFASSLRAGTYGGTGLGALAGILTSGDKKNFVDKIKHIVSTGAKGAGLGAAAGVSTAGYKTLKRL
jgi:hypothetical protein